MESREAIGSGNPAAAEDEQLVHVLDEYLEDLEAGVAVDVERLFAEHPALAPRLRACLAGLELLDAAATPRSSAATEMGGYTIVREIGRGGMGVVYEAVHAERGQRVALKVLPFAASLDPRQLQRFKLEAHAASHLHHPHIVPVYEVGWAGGAHFYTMKFIAGASLAMLWRQQRRGRLEVEAASKPMRSETLARAQDVTHDPASPAVLRWNKTSYVRSIARWAQQAALALEHAHQVGVIHRDIKPGNLLVDDGGHLWVTDFGLASVQGGAALTATGNLVGTLRYMSPEQASARRGVVDHRTDIYSLGVTLYELLTLDQAFHGRDREELLSQIAAEEPRAPRRLNPAIPVDLETITLTAMAKAPEERYATAKALADDLGRFLDGQPIHARRPGLPALVTRWALRHRAWTAAIGLFVLAATLILATSTVVVWRALLAEARQRALAESRELAGRRHLYAAEMKLALDDWREGHAARVWELLDRQRPAPGQQDLRGFEWHHLRLLGEHARCATLRGDGKPIFAVAAAKDGSVWASAGESGTIRLWDPVTFQPRATLPALGGPIRGLSLSPSGTRLACACDDGAIRIWDLATSALEHTVTGHVGAVGAVVFTPDDQKLLSCGRADGTVRVWNAADGQPQGVLTGMSNVPNSLAVSPDSRIVACAGNNRKIIVWDLATPDVPGEVLGEHGVYIHSLAFSCDGQTLVSGSEDGFVKLWDMPTRRFKKTHRRHTGAVAGAVFTPSGQVASVSWDGSVKFWDPATDQILLQQGHRGQVFAVTLALHGNRLLSAGEEGDVQVWELSTEPEPLVLTCDKGLIRGLAFSPDAQRLASAGDDHTVRIWDLTNPAQPLVLGRHTERVMGAVFNPAGSQLITADTDGNVMLWDSTSGSEIDQFEPVGGPLWSLALSRDGTLLAAAGYDSNTVLLWDVPTRKKRTTLIGHQDRVWSVAFSPDGRFVASGANDHTVRLWEALTGKQVAVIPVTEQWVFAVAFAPDGQTLAIGGGDRRVHLWDVVKQQERQPLGLQPASVRCLAFFPDSQTLVSGSDGGEVKLWDLATHQERATLHVQAPSIWSVTVSPDGQAIAAGDGDGKITVWRAARP